ncbi:DUF1996 domain-containing protein [Actinoplanes solisilvae]|uniref:DUF1996 domain-containing protein n=1 Tax=Actinoplanes solisilvae TaxID=2486853 RepID=UPI001F0C31BB|nr:DUF1996 domain-containing protein [Actinoplanes solisilvae]
MDPHRPRRILVLGAVAALTATAVLTGVRAAQAADTLLSQNKPALASSTENGGAPAAGAVDGNPATRWGSVWSDPQWLRVDLGGTATITSVKLTWEAAYARAFQLQTSADGNNWTTVYSTTTATGGTQTVPVTGSGRYVRMYGTQRGTGYGYSLYEFQVYGTLTSAPPTSGPGYIMADPPVTGVVPSTAVPPATNPPTTHHEFQMNCSVSRSNLNDDPIVFPGLPGVSHSHTFMGNTTTYAGTTLASLRGGNTSCITPGDKTGYWMPTLLNGTTAVQPEGQQVIYYKTGVIDYRSVRPFPLGLRYLVGSPTSTLDEFRNHPGAVEGFECGDLSFNWDIPANCVAGTQLNVRFQAPSCWNGLHLDTPDHKSHMAYPVLGVCPTSHPVAVPMIEFKMAWPVSGNMANVRFSSGRGFSFHYDVFNAFDPPTLAALTTHCINGGLQCDPRGFDLYKPNRGAALNENYERP